MIPGAFGSEITKIPPMDEVLGRQSSNTGPLLQQVCDPSMLHSVLALVTGSGFAATE